MSIHWLSGLCMGLWSPWHRRDRPCLSPAPQAQEELYSACLIGALRDCSAFDLGQPQL